MRMNQLLASVTDTREARTALELGADIIDCKDPSRGALGSLDSATIRQIVAAVAHRRPVSATVGDLPTDARILGDAIRLTAATGVDYVKVGLFDTRGVARTLNALSPLARRHRLIAVLFADRAPRLDILPELAAADFAGVMIDTADKGAGGLPDHATAEQLASFVDRAHRHRLLCGLAGSLKVEQVPRLTAFRADYLGFRGALCDGGRTSELNGKRFQLVRHALHEANADDRRAA